MPRCTGDVRSVGMLHDVDWYFVSDVSVQPVGPEVLKMWRTGCPKTPVNNY